MSNCGAQSMGPLASKNVAVSNNNTSAIDTYKDAQNNSIMNNPIQNTDLISLIKSDNDNAVDVPTNLILAPRNRGQRQ